MLDPLPLPPHCPRLVEQARRLAAVCVCVILHFHSRAWINDLNCSPKWLTVAECEGLCEVAQSALWANGSEVK